MHLTLYKKPLCHTLSNALEISRKTPFHFFARIGVKSIVNAKNNKNELSTQTVMGLNPYW